ncbi:hypothetical protein HYV69_01510 [Candidatus Uhrbacteria bacterium]|nr:hypothetical protein [Candidatus Uhrbacteria bacterium]
MKLFERFRNRIHESIALGAFMSAALTLQIAWISNLLVHRSETVRDLFNILPSIGPISGLYFKTIIAYVFLFGLSVLFFKGRDCSVWRGRVFGFFYISIVMFFVLTMPVVYEFSVSVSE